MAPIAETDFEVWGNPVSHSLSPTLHRAAYAALGLPWSYRYREVTQELITPAWVGVGENLGGISLTMPLKERVLDIIAPRDSIVDQLHAANTVYRAGRTRVLSNTDPFGVEHALERFDIEADRAWILGAGATARSVGYALWKRGATSVTIFARDKERAEGSAHYLRQCGLSTQVQHFSELDQVMPPHLVASTLPGDQDDLPDLPAVVVQSAALFDVAYSPWPSHYARAWASSSQPVVSGLWMLAYQALAQIRLFVHEDVSVPLPQEDKVFAAMLAAVGLPTE